MTKYITAVFGFLFITKLFWLGGFDFDTRGPTAFFWFLLSSLFSIAGFLYTLIWEEESKIKE